MALRIKFSPRKQTCRLSLSRPPKNRRAREITISTWVEASRREVSRLKKYTPGL